MRKSVFVAVLGILFLTIAGCGKFRITSLPEPTIVHVDISATNTVNPDGNKRPSPIVVRLYELKGLKGFNESSFKTIYSDDETRLGDDFIARQEYVLTPGSSEVYMRETPQESRFIGVIAAYRNIESAVWRAALAIPANRTSQFTIVLDAAGLVITEIQE